MFKPPTEDEKKKAKKVSGKTYYWCSAANMWGTHTASECRAGKQKHYGDDEKADKRRIKFSKALQAVAEDDESSSGTNE